MKTVQTLLCTGGLLFFAACNNDTTQITVTTTSTDTAITTTPPVEKEATHSPTSTEQKRDTTIAEKDTTINGFISNNMKGWTVPDKNTWDAKWYKQYDKGTNKVYRLQADFDGNNTTDYTYILKNAADQFAVWAFLKTAESYNPVKVYDITRIPGKLHVGLALLQPGTYKDIDGEKPKAITTKVPAIHVIFFGTAAKAYYWKDGQFNLIQTGD